MKLAGWNANTTGAPRKSERVTGEPVCDVKVKSGAISPGLIAMSNTIQSAIGDRRQNCKHTPLTPAGVGTRYYLCGAPLRKWGLRRGSLPATLGA